MGYITLFKLIKIHIIFGMKKIFFTFLTLLSFVFILILPVFLWLHANMMPHHDMDAGDCVEHCISSEDAFHSPRIISLWAYIEVFIAKILFTKIFEFVIPLSLLYVLLIHAPPNLHLNIKNYNYSSLVWIVKLTT